MNGQRIIPTDYGTFVNKVDSGEQVLMTREDLFNRIVTQTGGRAAEEIFTFRRWEGFPKVEMRKTDRHAFGRGEKANGWQVSR